MKHSFICATNFMNNKQVGAHSDFHLALSHLINGKGEPNEYTKELIKSGKPIYLDNGVFETGHPESIDSLINKIYYLQSLGAKPRVVFIPDELYDSEATYNNLLEWNKKYSTTIRDRCKIQSCVVLQGSSKKDFMNLLEKVRNNSDMIALSYLSCVKCFKEETGTEDIATNRIAALKVVNERLINRKVHLLGLGDSLEDLKFAKTLSTLNVSNDSSSAFVLGMNNKGYEKDGTIKDGKIHKKVDFDLKELDSNQLSQIEDNIRFIKQL